MLKVHTSMPSSLLTNAVVMKLEGIQTNIIACEPITTQGLPWPAGLSAMPSKKARSHAKEACSSSMMMTKAHAQIESHLNLGKDLGPPRKGASDIWSMQRELQFFMEGWEGHSLSKRFYHANGKLFMHSLSLKMLEQNRVEGNRIAVPMRCSKVI